MRSLETPDIFLDDEIDCDPAHEICTTCILDGYFSVLQSPCHLELASWSAVDIIQDAVLPSSTSSFFDQAVHSDNLVIHSSSQRCHLRLNAPSRDFRPA